MGRIGSEYFVEGVLGGNEIDKNIGPIGESNFRVRFLKDEENQVNIYSKALLMARLEAAIMGEGATHDEAG